MSNNLFSAAMPARQCRISSDDVTGKRLLDPGTAESDATATAADTTRHATANSRNARVLALGLPESTYDAPYPPSRSSASAYSSSDSQISRRASRSRASLAARSWSGVHQ
jgi:hypothetical protein